MNIAIVSFQNNTDIIGAKYVHSFMRAQGHTCYLILQPHPDSRSDEAIIRFVQERGIQLVGISLMSSEFFRASRFAKELKRRFNSIPIVFGGIHATIAPDECLSSGDFVVRGEGEHTFLALVRCLEQSRGCEHIPGLCFKKEDAVHANPLPPLTEDIDSFPFPQHLPQNMYVVHRNAVTICDHQLFNSYSRYHGAFPNIITTRGCPYSCTYCCNSAYTRLYGSAYNRVRKRSVESVISECLEITRQNTACLSLNIQDDCFFAYSDAWLDEFSERYRKTVELPLIIRTTPKHVTKEKLTSLKKAGLAIVMIGLQSGSDRVNKEIYKRNVTSEEFLAATELVRDAGVCGYYDVILDNCYETKEDVLRTLEVILRIRKPFQLQLFSLCLYPGTELHETAKDEGISFMDPRLDDYLMPSSTPLNKLIHMSPTFPAPVIRCLARKRDACVAAVAIRLLETLNIAILTPLSFLGMMHRAYGSDFRVTGRLIRAFGRTALDKMLRAAR